MYFLDNPFSFIDTVYGPGILEVIPSCLRAYKMTEFGVAVAISVCGVQCEPSLILYEIHGSEHKTRAILIIYSRIRSGIAVVRIWKADDNCILQVLGWKKTALRDRHFWRLCLLMKSSVQKFAEGNL
jgi:hypothetical protein